MYSCPCLVGLVLGISSPNSWTQQPHEPLGIACLIPGMRGSGCWVGSEMTTNGHDHKATLLHELDNGIDIPSQEPQDSHTQTKPSIVRQLRPSNSLDGLEAAVFLSCGLVLAG